MSFMPNIPKAARGNQALHTHLEAKRSFRKWDAIMRASTRKVGRGTQQRSRGLTRRGLEGNEITRTATVRGQHRIPPLAATRTWVRHPLINPPGSNFGQVTGYYKRDSSWFSSVYQDSTSK
jgi:hypothetical protein